MSNSFFIVEHDLGTERRGRMASARHAPVTRHAHRGSPIRPICRFPPVGPLAKCGNLAGSSGIVGIPGYADADDLFEDRDISGVLECALAQ